MPRKLADSYPYPVQTWALGNGPTWTTLGGEVVVDFALRIKKEHPDRPLWVAGYANDVMRLHPVAAGPQGRGYEGGRCCTTAILSVERRGRGADHQDRQRAARRERRSLERRTSSESACGGKAPPVPRKSSWRGPEIR